MIDASIPLGIRPAQAPNIEDPIASYGKAVQLKALLGQGQLQDVQLKQAQQALDDENAVRSAYQQAGSDPVKLRDILMKGGAYKQIQALDKLDLEKREKESLIGKNTADAGQTRAKTDVIALQHGAAVLDAVKTLPPEQQAQGYQAALSIMDRLSPGASQNILKAMPTYNPQQAAQLVQAGLTQAEKLKAEHDAAVAAETARHNKSSEGIQIRGQNMVDARSREGNEIQRTAGRTEIKETPDGFFAIDKGTGKAIPVTADGRPITGKGKDLTESQGKATTFGMRAREASNILDTIGNDGKVQPNLLKRSVEAVPIVGESAGSVANTVPRWLGGPSSAQQQVEQAQRDFVNAVLRLESGASISPAEFENAKKQYFPQPGDSPQVIAQKRQNRETEIAGLGQMAGPGSKSIKPAASRSAAGKVGGVLTQNPDGSYNYGGQ